MIFTGGGGGGVAHTSDLTFCLRMFEKYGNIAKKSYCRQNGGLSVSLSFKNLGKSTSSHLSA